MHITPLNDAWEFRRLDGEPSYPRSQVGPMPWYPATVPGAVHLDLAAAGIIPDPFGRAYEWGAQWVDEARWVYRCAFQWQPRAGAPNRVLRFQGLDTVCTVFLNDEEIAKHDNMFLPLEVDVTTRLVPGQNQVEVRFDSAVKTGEERREVYFAKEGLPHSQVLFDERAFVRKAAYMSGWDWGARLVSCGIWQPVQLIEFESRLISVDIGRQILSDGSYRISIDADVDGSGKAGAEFDGQRREPGETLEFLVADPKLWWPNGEGDSHLYDLRVFLANGHEIRKRIGLRTIKLLREEDVFGKSFEFEVNGRRIWCRGANWIPNDSFPGRIKDEDIAEQITTCKSMNMNMLRVWGGGLYESEAFYDACDEAGILVWQDFPYACSYYPDGADEQAAAAKEAEYHVRRLRHRPCLALWCGNNENSMLWESGWGGMENRPSRYYGENLYDKTLPEVIAREDPCRPYIPSSPMYMDESVSDSHYWDVWHGRGDWRFYRDSKARFSSEFGFASSCSLACWEPVLKPEDRSPRSGVVRSHDKTLKPVETFEGYVLQHYPQWESLEEWVYYSQLNQRDALREGIEHYRRSEFCKGALIWQVNDCWPVQSWAVQDYARHLKPAGFELQRLYAPWLVSIDKHDDLIDVYVLNDGPIDLWSELIVEAVSTLSGEIIGSWTSKVARESAAGGPGFSMSTGGFDPKTTVIRANLLGLKETTTWQLLAEPKETKLGVPEIRIVGENPRAIEVKGFVADLVVWNPNDSKAIIDPATGLFGWRAMTLANESVSLGASGPMQKLAYRHLGGSGELVCRPEKRVARKAHADPVLLGDSPVDAGG